MITQDITSTQNVISNAISNTEGANGTLGKDSFLQLLVTQMRFQDPMNPLEDREFIAQLAQFSSLEQMQQVNENLMILAQLNSTAQAASLMGKQIAAFDSAGNPVSGRVDAVLFEDGLPWLVIGDTKISPANVALIEA